MIIEGKLPTVPEYYSEFIDSSVDLVANPKQCCPLHSENTPSFSYDVRTGKCSCFGSCHAYGMDVIELHRRRMGQRTREESRVSLCAIYKVSISDSIVREKQESLLNANKVDDTVLLFKAERMAKGNIDRMLELDYVMSIYPFDKIMVEELIDKWSEE